VLRQFLGPGGSRLHSDAPRACRQRRLCAVLAVRAESGRRGHRRLPHFIREAICEIFYDQTYVNPELVDEVYTMLSDRPYRRYC